MGDGKQSVHSAPNVVILRSDRCGRQASYPLKTEDSVAAQAAPKLFVTAIAEHHYSINMPTGFSGDITINVIASIIASLVLLAAGFLWGKYKERRKYGRNLEEYDFYPFTINRENFPEFNLKDFRLGMHYFLKNNDYTAARQLIFIGEQNNVRAQLEPSEQKVYARLFEKYEGKKIADDTTEYLENYVRIVRLIGKSFPNSGIEILLHNLADPSHSLIVLENNVTGRHLRDGTTNLLIDLKKRQLLQED